MYNVPHINFKITGAQQSSIAFTLLFAAVFTYLYFLNVSVAHVVMRKEASKEASQLRTEIAALETSFIDSQHKIADRIGSESYNTEADKIFITRGQTGLVLRDN